MDRCRVVFIGFALASLLFLITACSNSVRLEQALELAGKNRNELQKVLNRYKQSPVDSLKYRAACFLIENMPYYHYYEGKHLDNYLTYFKTLAYDRSQKSSLIMDTYINRYGYFSLSNLDVKYDVQQIDSAYLCNNIEWAFKVWKEQPWGKNILFSDFCEYILPYRVGDEQLVVWRDSLYKEFNPLLDSLRSTKCADDPIVAANVLLKALSKNKIYYTTDYPSLMPHLGPFDCQYLVGSCREITDYVLYACRAVGIPCGEDFMPLSGDGNAGHSWAFILDKHGDSFMEEFPCDIKPVTKNGGINIAKPSKVYRCTFSVNQQMAQELSPLGSSSSLYPFFHNPKYIDVTTLYRDRVFPEISIPLNVMNLVKYNKEEIVYLCQAQYQDWVPIAFGKIEDTCVKFNNIGVGAICRIALWRENHLEFISTPFTVSEEGKPSFYILDKKSHDIVLYSKFNLRFEEYFFNKLLAGVFEASNDLNFKKKDTLYSISSIPSRLYTSCYVVSPKKYRYVRYRAADKVSCHIAEIAFFTNVNDTIRLKGCAIGSHPASSNLDYKKVFDSDPSTSFESNGFLGGWVGLDLGTPQEIRKIVYTPANRDNFIRKEATYELYYFDKHWVSLGRKTADADSLVYQDVPINALLYLDCLKGIEKRIFTYENGKQVWW
ncbi:discoidin domain-containing protein [Bacteroides graminisolvens]|uniref:discoidin domain-containing protein n=1 Tax=Bacteroides graminisolvens TaxID=477666 RepID=UPI0029C70612|nr:discoidin domain-containing protein [Bacteroides graminisolvens]